MMHPTVPFMLLRLTRVGARGGGGIRLDSSSLSAATVSSLSISPAGVVGVYIGALPLSFCGGGDFGCGVGAGGVGEELVESDPTGLSWGGLGVCSAGAVVPVVAQSSLLHQASRGIEGKKGIPQGFATTFPRNSL
ncbi:hypothetical protein V6N11_054533 [Hibiscus sabdariffa]|uniref:30S ribosomal protein S16, chloroplastic n=1 Tax=Hibiscus sabdariffa TaxID=183260 RepID=A0ABR2S477_9ROSI